MKAADATEQLWTNSKDQVSHTVLTKFGRVVPASTVDWIPSPTKTDGQQMSWGGSRPYLTEQKDLLQLKLGLMTPTLSFQFRTGEETG